MATSLVRVQCPWCGHGKMHYGETMELRGEARIDVFSCRGCGSVYDQADMEEEYAGCQVAIDAIQRAGKER